MRRGRLEREHLLLDLYGWYLLPAYTLLFAGHRGWFDTNFSVLAVSGITYYRSFLLWGAVTAVYFGGILVRLTALLAPSYRLRVLGLMGGALLSLSVGIPLPYLPEQFPKLARIHLMLCFATCVWLMAALLAVIVALYRRERNRYASMLSRWWYIIVGSGILFGLAGMISSAMEVYFVLSAALLCRRLYELREEAK